MLLTFSGSAARTVDLCSKLAFHRTSIHAHIANNGKVAAFADEVCWLKTK